MPLNVSELGLNIISSFQICRGVSSYKELVQFISTCMLEKGEMVTLTLPRGKN